MQEPIQSIDSRLSAVLTVPDTRRERRTQARQPVDTAAIIFLIKIGSRLPGRIVDLSLGGCRIHTDERFPLGIYTRVETEFRLEGLPFRLGGVIQAIHDCNTVGIRFLDLSDRKRRQVQELIDEIETLRAVEALDSGAGSQAGGP
jgi:PilZ domain